MKVIYLDAEGIGFDDGSTLFCKHEQDCCEDVYADFSSLQDEAGFMDADFQLTKDCIECVSGSGFRIKDTKGNAYFVPCYSKQNGYYSNNLTLIYKARDKKDCFSVDVEKGLQYEYIP